MRTKARECAFKIIYASLFNESNEESFRRGIYKACDLDDSGREFSDKIILSVAEHKEELLNILNEYSIGFSDKRIFPVDKSVLLMALAEIKYFDDVPNIVAVNEAVGLAKKYSTEKSAGYVNGLLAAYLTGESL